MLGYKYESGSLNRIYFLGGPQRHFYNEVGKFDAEANNLALVYCHFEKLNNLAQFNKVFVSSDMAVKYLNRRAWYLGKLFKKEPNLCTKYPIQVIRPFSSLAPVANSLPRYECDISFMGTPRVRPIVEHVLPIVEKYGYKFNIYGPNWSEYQGNPLAKKYWVSPTIPYKHIPMLARNSKICLIDHHDSMNQIGTVSHKYIDFIMSGGFVISDENLDVVRNYSGIVYENGLELTKILLEYLPNEELRQQHVLKQQRITFQQTTLSAAIHLASEFL